MRHLSPVKIALITTLSVCLVSCGGGSSTPANALTSRDGSTPPPTPAQPSGADDYMRIDSTPAAIGSEINQRFLILDLTHNRIFVSNRFLNRVDVFSTA